MTAKYFIYFIIILLFAMIFLAVSVWRWHARLRYLQNLTRINLLKRQQKMNHSTFFATAVVNQCVRLLYLSRSTLALKTLVAGHTERATELLMSENYYLAVLV